MGCCFLWRGSRVGGRGLKEAEGRRSRRSVDLDDSVGV
jgi:hypothetical protein